MNSAQKIILQASRFLKSRVSLTKTVAMTTVVAFMVSSVIGPAAYAASTPVPGVARTIKESLSAFQLPYSLGRVTDAKYLGSKKVVVAIQDLHCHPEVQRNISGILGILDDKYGKQQFKVLVEGGMGPIDTSWLNKISDPKVRANAVEALMNAGRLTGAEYYAIQTKQYGLLQGLEDEKPYFENLARLTQIMDTRGDFAGRIGEFKAALAAVTNLYYTAGNRRLDKIAAKREARTLDTEKYYKILLKLAAREHIALYDFPATTNFLEVMAQQRRLSYTAVNKQLSKFLETLKDKLPFNVYNQLVAKASRPNGLEDVYVILAKAAPGMDISQYPELAKFFRFVEINQKMNPIDLVKEERALLGELRGRLSRSRAEREVAFLADFLRYLQGYYENRMSADDYEYYTSHAQAFYEMWGRYADARLLPSLDQYKDLFGKFYKTNIDRNRIFMEKIGAGDSSPASRSASASVEENIFLMSTQLSQAQPGAEVSVVVTGGFHTQGLAQLLEEQGISYVVITPSVTGGTDFAQRMYDLFARELSGQAVAQGKISRSITARPANPSIDSYGLWLAASSDVSLSADALVSKARDMGLQTAVIQLAAQGMTAAQIVEKLNEQNNAAHLKAQLAGLGYANQGLLAITSEDENVVFRDQKNNFALSIPVSGEVSVAVKTAAGNLKAPDGLSAELRKTIEALLGSSIGDSDVAYFSGLYDQYKNPRPAAELKFGSKAGDFIPSALLSDSERASELGATELDDIKKNEDKYARRARSVVLRRNPMNGGIGSSVGRESYLDKIWAFLGRTRDVILGAKASDLFIDVTIDGKHLKVSISEAKLLRALKERALYQHTIMQQYASSESIDSINLLLDTRNAYARAGQATVYGDMTYRQILEQRGTNISYGDTVVQQALPTIAQGQLSGEHRAPGGHGQWGVYTLLDALNSKLPAEGTLISAIYNEDGINNTVDPLMTGWMAEEGVPLVMVSTTKTAIDKKGGQIGIVRTPQGIKTEMMELAQAQTAGQEPLFYDMGLTEGQRDAQYFNTNTVLANISVLQPFLRDLVNAIGYDEFVKIISPTLIQNKKNKGKPNEYTQLEGALGSVLLNLDGFLSTTENPKVLDVLKKHNIKKLVRIVNVGKEDRTKYFTPVKTAFDYWLQFHSDLFTMNVETWELDTNRPGFIPEVSLSDAYYADVQNVLDAFGSASTVGLDALKVTGKVLLKDAVLKGNVVINSASSEVVDLNNPQLGLPKDANGRLLLENISISIAADGTVTEVRAPVSAAPSVSPAGGSAGAAMEPLVFPVLEDVEGKSATVISDENWRKIREFNDAVRLRMQAITATRKKLKDGPAYTILGKEFEALRAYQSGVEKVLTPKTGFPSADQREFRPVRQTPRYQVTSIIGHVRALQDWYADNAAELADAYASLGTAGPATPIRAASPQALGIGFDPILAAVRAMRVAPRQRDHVLALIESLVAQGFLRAGPMSGNMHTYVLSNEAGKQTQYDNPLQLFQEILAESKLSPKQRSKVANAFMQAAIQSDQRTLTVFTHIFSQFDKMQEHQLEAGAQLEQLEYNELHQRALAALATIALRHASGEIDPDVNIRISQNAPEIEPVAREVKVGIYALAGNPMHWAHILIPFEAIAAAGLDTVIFVLSGPDDRKPALAGTAKYRFKMGTTFVNDVFDGFAQVSPIALETSDGADGETNIFRILDLNPRQKINAYYMVGGDHYAVSVVKNGIETPDTVGKLLTNLASYRDSRSPGYNHGRKNHVVSAIFIGRSGEKMDPAIARNEAVRRNMSFEVHFLEGFKIAISSTRIREALREGDVPALSILPYWKFRYIQKHPMFQLMITGVQLDGEEYAFESLVDMQAHRELAAFVSKDGRRVFVTEAPRAGRAGKKDAPGIAQGATPDRQIDVNGQQFYVYNETTFETAISARQNLLDEQQGGTAGIQLTHFENIRWVRYLQAVGVPAPIVSSLISIVEMPRFFTISIPNKNSFLAGQLWGIAAIVAVGLAVMFLFMPVGPVVSAVATTSAQLITAIQSVSLGLLMIARPRVKSRGELHGFVEAHKVGQYVALPKITRSNTAGKFIINGRDIVNSEDAVKLIEQAVDESIDVLRTATLNKKINALLDQLDEKLQKNSNDPFTINSTIDLYGQLVAAVKENDDGIDAAVDGAMPSITIKNRLIAVWMGVSVILGLVIGIPLNIYFVQYLVYSFAFLKALPIISNLYQHSRFNKTSTGIIFTAGPSAAAHEAGEPEALGQLVFPDFYPMDGERNAQRYTDRNALVIREFDDRVEARIQAISSNRYNLDPVSPAFETFGNELTELQAYLEARNTASADVQSQIGQVRQLQSWYALNVARLASAHAALKTAVQSTTNSAESLPSVLHVPHLEEMRTEMSYDEFAQWSEKWLGYLDNLMDQMLNDLLVDAKNQVLKDIMAGSRDLKKRIEVLRNELQVLKWQGQPTGNKISLFAQTWNRRVMPLFNPLVDQYNAEHNQPPAGNAVSLTTKWTKKYVATPLDKWLISKGVSEARRKWLVDIAVGVVEYPVSLLGPLFGIMHFQKGDTVKDRVGLVVGGTALLAVSVAMMSVFGFAVTPASFFATWGANAVVHVVLNRLFRQAGMRDLTLGEGQDDEEKERLNEENERLREFIPGMPMRKAEILGELQQRNANTAEYLKNIRFTAEDIDSVRAAALARIDKELRDIPVKPDPDMELDMYNIRRTRLEKQQRELQTFAMHNSVVTKEDIVALLQLAPVELLDRVLATNTFPQMHVDAIRNEQGIYYLLGEEIALLEEMSIQVLEPGWFDRIDAPLRATSLKTLKLHENFVTVHDTEKPPTLRLLYTSVLFNHTLYKGLQPGIDGLRPVQPASTYIELPVPVSQQAEQSPSIALLPFPEWVTATAHPFIVPQTLSAAVGEFLENPIDYTVLRKGVHAVVVPRLTTAVEERAITRAMLTGATVAIIGSIDASERGNYRPINGSGYLCRKIEDVAKGKVVEIVFVRDPKTVDLLMKDALTVAARLSGDLVVCGQVDTALVDITDYRNGLQVSVLELGYRNPDTASVTKVMSHMVTKPVVVMSADATGEAGNVATDGVLWPVRTQADYIAQMHWLNDRALYKNTVYVQPVSAVAAIAPRKLDSEKSIIAMLSDMDRHLENLSHSNIDTLLLNVAPDAWADAAVQLQLKRLIDTLRMKGIRVGFFEDVDINSSRNPGRFRVMGSLAAQRNGEEVMVYLRAAQQDAKMGAVTRDIERLASRAIPGVKVLCEDSNGIRDMAASSGAADPSYLLASETLLSNSSELLDKVLRNARMIILDAPVTAQLQSDNIRYEHSVVKNHWQGLHEAFRNKIQNTPAYALAKGVSDARRGMVKYGNRDYARLAAAVAEAMQDPRAADKLRFAVQATAEEASVRTRVMSIPAGIWNDKALDPEHEAADAAYRIGFVRGLIEQVFAREEIVVDGRPVELSPDARQQYAAARLQQWLLEVAAQPAQPLQDIANITGIANDENIPQYRTDIPALPRMTAQGATVSAQKMVDVLARIARTASDAGQQKYALAGIIELLRLYGERNIPETIIEQTNDVVKTELLKALLGAA